MKGFNKLSTEDFPARVIMSVQGAEKTGKTHFSLTAPKPLYYFDFDNGLEGTSDDFDGEDIHVAAFQEHNGNINIAKAEWDRFNKMYRACLDDANARTIVIDTATDLWELLRMAKLGKLTQVLPVKYTEINSDMKHLFDLAKSHDKNVIFLHKEKALWQNNQQTDQMVLDGFNKTAFEVHANLRALGQNKDGEFVLRVLNSKHTPALSGVDYTGPENTFFEIAESMVAGAGE